MKIAHCLSNATFWEAFAADRAAGAREFTWRGNSYHPGGPMRSIEEEQA